MFPPGAPFFNARLSTRAAEIAARAEEDETGNLPVPRDPSPEWSHDHSATSTESTAGRWRAASIHSSPSLGETKIEPLFVPK